jgi:hypothetical protein
MAQPVGAETYLGRATVRDSYSRRQWQHDLDAGRRDTAAAVQSARGIVWKHRCVMALIPAESRTTADAPACTAFNPQIAARSTLTDRTALNVHVGPRYRDPLSAVNRLLRPVSRSAEELRTQPRGVLLGRRSGADRGMQQTRPCSHPVPARALSEANVPKSVPNGHENGPRSNLRGPFRLVAGTGFEPATSGL